MKDRQHNGQKKNGKKNKQRSTKHTHKTNEKVYVSANVLSRFSCICGIRYLKFNGIIEANNTITKSIQWKAFVYLADHGIKVRLWYKFELILLI
jgi:hypothetical protein